MKLLQKSQNINTTFLNRIGLLGFSGLLLAVRIGMTRDFFFSFLVWNLFLASVPYLVTSGLLRCQKSGISKGWFFMGFGLWLLFFPNSPYIITDLVHLQNERAIFPWYDMFLVFVFAFNGLLLGMLSLWDMYGLLRVYYREKTSRYVLIISCFLAGYGIYLGRFLRFNSWDVLTKPWMLLQQGLYGFYELKAWYITFAFGGFLWTLFVLMRSFNNFARPVVNNSHD